MENEKQLEGNKLIAQFMGGNNDNMLKAWFFPEETKPPFALLALEQFQYHKSWDWLIPVLVKLNKVIPMNTFDLGFIHIALRNCNIEQCFQEIVQVIQYYNKEKNQ